MSAQKTKPQFQKESPNGFYSNLKIKAKSIIEEQHQKANIISWSKLIVYPSLYALAYILLLVNGESLIWFYSCYSVMGLLVTLIVFNIVHDAVHHGLFKNQLYNKRASVLLDLLGGNSFVWGKRHVLYHHTFTNVPGWDIDIKQTNLLRFNKKQQYLPVYRYQHIYMPFLYLFYSLNWILVRDFKDFFSSASLIKQKTKIEKIEYWKLFFFKAIHFTGILVIPILFLQHAWYIFITGFILMHWFTSALTLLVLLPSHLDEHACFPEVDKNMMLEDTWAVHQLKVTNDFGTDHPVLNFIMGGLNHHIAHHLFPTVNHNIIPKITQHIVNDAAKNHLPYRCYTLKKVMISHFRLLKQNSVQHNFFEE
jgi:linoleoyl-CoA desaturase